MLLRAASELYRSCKRLRGASEAMDPGTPLGTPGTPGRDSVLRASAVCTADPSHVTAASAKFGLKAPAAGRAEI